jgi:hypothetical protein
MNGRTSSLPRPCMLAFPGCHCLNLLPRLNTSILEFMHSAPGIA